jgi:hypothetical protein
MRPKLLSLCLLAGLCAAAPARGQPLAEALVGSWTCTAQEGTAEEGTTDIAMTLNYRLSDDFLIGEIKEDNGATLVDIWLDDDAQELVLRRIVSYDATIEMQVAEETPDLVRLEGEMRHRLGSTAKVREEIRFTGTEEFRAVWEADSGQGWQPIMDRTCKRI